MLGSGYPFSSVTCDGHKLHATRNTGEYIVALPALPMKQLTQDHDGCTEATCMVVD
jgi:hypothetical protein